MALLDYLTKRRAEIETQLKVLRAELAEIGIAENALTGATPERRTVTVYAGGMLREGTIKDWIMKALTGFQDGLETEAVIEAVRKMGGPLVERSSITPQLSRLKAAGLIAQDGRLWRLPTDEDKRRLALQRSISRVLGTRNETSGVSPPDASEDEDLSDLV